MGAERQQLREYLADARSDARASRCWTSRPSGSFNGGAAWFYDGVHVTRRNANRVIVAAKAKAGEYLK